jgi:integrase
MRISELQALKWKDVRESTIDDKSAASKHNPEGKIYIFYVKETKPLRIKPTGSNIRQIVAPFWMDKIFDLIKTENPEFCSKEDHIINYRGAKRKSQGVMFQRVQELVSNGKNKINCLTHSSGTTLDLRHTRSYFVSDRLLQKGINPVVLARYCGHSLQTILSYYLTEAPTGYMKTAFGGHHVHEKIVDSLKDIADPFHD